MTMGVVYIGDYVVSIRKALGRGAFGSVYPATHKDGRQIAAKQIESEKEETAKKELTGSENLLKAFKAQNHEHENITKIHDILPDEYNDIWLMMEYCEFGDLNKYFDKHPEKFNDISIKLDMMCQIASGLAFLHSIHIVHRDIKPNNILVSKNLNQLQSDTVKIADFGLCKYLDPDDTTSCMNTDAGTNLFKAPEFFNYKVDGKIEYHKSVDSFAAGLTFLAMIQPMGDSRKLVPHVEGNLYEYEHALPIGQCMMNRHHKGQQQIAVVVERLGDTAVANMIRRIIKGATDVTPTYRMSSSTMYEYLKALHAAPDHELQGLPMANEYEQQLVWGGASADNIVRSPGGPSPPGHFMKPAAEPFIGAIHVEESMQYGEGPTIQPKAVPIDHHEANRDNTAASAAPAQFQSAIPQKDLMQISHNIAPSKMTQFAIMYLDTNMEEINIEKARYREQVEMVGFAILKKWVQKNPGASKRQLYDLFCEGSKKGWINRNAYKLLIE